MDGKKYIHSKKIHNIKGAKIIVPEIIKIARPKSVLDIGCGIGTWLYIFSQNGIKDLMGIDGDYVDRDLLFNYISPEQFKAVDLEMPFDLGKKFDLAISLEVAEHLSESASDNFVKSICSQSDVVIFSAAIPGQGGQNHINEQWPIYWAEKFKNHNYVFLDIIRPLIWENNAVDYWYRQNIFVAAKKSHPLAMDHKESCLSLVHPILYEKIADDYKKKIKYLENQLKVHPFKRWLKSILMKK